MAPRKNRLSRRVCLGPVGLVHMLALRLGEATSMPEEVARSGEQAAVASSSGDGGEAEATASLTYSAWVLRAALSQN